LDIGNRKDGHQDGKRVHIGDRGRKGGSFNKESSVSALTEEGSSTKEKEAAQRLNLFMVQKLSGTMGLWGGGGGVEKEE